MYRSAFSIKRFVLAAAFFASCSGDGSVTFPGVKVQFPEGSTMGLFLAIAVPLDLPDYSPFLALNFEANYRLPPNITSFDYPPIIERRFDRKLAYDAVEGRIESHGYPGRKCLLRIICEASIHTVTRANGVLGDILHILLTPSSSLNENLNSDYQQAEETGRNKKNCDTYSKGCSISFLDMISTIENVI